MNKTIDLDASYYQNHSEQQYERAQELLNSLNIKPSASVLDIGCGHGNITAEISLKVPNGKIIGIDASHKMIRHAKEKFPNSQFPNLEFLEIKAEEMYFPESSFDLIVCFSCLLWIREPKKALELMCKSLKPGGILVILTYLKESSYVHFLEKTLEKFPSYKNLSAVHTMLSMNEYKDILTSHQIALEDFIPRSRFTEYKNKEELKAYLKGWITCYVPLPEQLQDQFLDEAVENSLAENLNKNLNEEILLQFQQLTIKARKHL
ncbi:MAG: methyltransferase domain-containing protein [Parachlamydiales bacterium]|nr:methyltransferase domain-containing protein [Candidatus Acheromyda pituitae]